MYTLSGTWMIQGCICNKKGNGGNKMVKVTHAAISAIKSEVKDVIVEGKRPMIRFSMGLG
jgi:hypothetical protein